MNVNDRQLQAIRDRVNGDYNTKVAWSEWTQAEKDRALLLAALDDEFRDAGESLERSKVSDLRRHNLNGTCDD